jgi:hypothetical protein|tara:strand:- start:1994 stop:2413 length:420 start_codon:yes stop_codon:yes gene_type:complete
MIDVFDALRLAFDTGMLALIWLVQLIIYPGLAMYNDVNLRIWHPIYTKRVTLVVLPLMFGQLILSAYKVLNVGVLTDDIHLVLVLSAWAITFLRAVPLHRALEGEDGGANIAIRLVHVNKARTIVWSLAWIVSLVILLL